MKDVLHEIAEELGKLDSIDEAIAMAIDIEEEGMGYYSEKASVIGNEAASKLYLFLAEEEKKHAEYLKQYRENRKIPEIEFNYPKFKASFKEEFSDEKLEEIGILLAALRFERKNEYFYMELAKKSSDDDAQRVFFEKMAAVERSHYMIIDELLDSATEFRMQT